jgi:ATP adenylyltransferase
MQALHAPWRIQYILGPKEPPGDGSLFTRIAQSSDDEGNLVIARDRTCFAMLNRYPYVGGHLMVVPYRQVRDFTELTDGELLELMKLLCRCQQALTRAMKPDGFNVGVNLGRVAGAGIEEHLHVHIVPRWNGDTNFMPVLAGTTVVPEALSETAAKLRAALSLEPSSSATQN